MSSKIEICNLALGFLGEAPIADMDAQTPAAQFCKLYFRPALSELLREHPWNFATAREKLTPLEAPAAFAREYKCAYAYPALCLNLHFLIDEHGQKDRDFMLAFDVSRTIILSNLADAVAAFTRYVDDSTRFDPAFGMAFARKMQCMLVKPLLKNNTSLVKEAEELFRQALEAARLQDVRESRQIQDASSLWNGGHDLWADSVTKGF